MNFVTSTTSVKHRNKLFRSAEESFQGCGLKLHLFLSTALKSPFIAHNYSAIIFRKRWLFGFLEGLITFRGSLGWSLVAYLKSLCTPGEKLELALRETSPPPPPPPSKSRFSKMGRAQKLFLAPFESPWKAYNSQRDFDLFSRMGAASFTDIHITCTHARQ